MDEERPAGRWALPVVLRWDKEDFKRVDQDTAEAMIVRRGIYDGQSDRAYAKISGFVQTQEGHFERFDETAINTVFELDAVHEQLREAGFRSTYFARADDLATPIENPENETRVFAVARLGA
jgi:hypothetical protein